MAGQLLGERHVFDPTTDRVPIGPDWLSDLEREHLERVLDDLPELCRQLDANYDALLAAGDRDPHDSAIRYVVKFDAIDLADRRMKWERSAARTEPLTLADRHIAGPAVDPEWWADMARRMGDRRRGVLPTLIGWVSIACNDLVKAGIPFDDPADPDLIVWAVDTAGHTTATKPGPTIASQARWLRRQLPFIFGRPWSAGMAPELAGIARDLEQLVGPANAYPDQHTTLTAREIADRLDRPFGTVRRWISEGSLQPAADRDGNPVLGPKGKPVYYLTEARSIAIHNNSITKGRKTR